MCDVALGNLIAKLLNILTSIPVFCICKSTLKQILAGGEAARHFVLNCQRIRLGGIGD